MMTVRRSVVAVCMALCGFGPTAFGDFCPPGSPQSDGMRDIMLVYANTNGWRQANFLPYVAYVDSAGKPRDWFYDAFLFMMFSGSPSGATYISGATDRRDWEFYLDEEFAPGRELAALDATIGAVSRDMGMPARSVPIIAMIPYPSAKQKDFGDADGDGATEDFSTDNGRRKAVRWLLREFKARWEARRFRHLKLWGFYWMNEGVSPADEAIVKATADEIHSLDCKFHWIPWFNAPGVTKWRELGFDLTIMQPNYAFIPPRGLRRIPDENRLTTAANICRRLGMGIEMELNMGIDMDARRDAAVDPRDRINLMLYLDHGDDSLDGYRKGAVRAYYQGYNAIAGLCYSGEPELRRLYDDLYQFHKGTYRRRRPYQALASEEKCLTDGIWKTRPEVAAEAVALSKEKTTLAFPMDGIRLVGDVRVHFQPGDIPSRIHLELEAGNGAFEEVAAEDDVAIREEDGGGFAVLTCPTRPVRQIRLHADMAGDRRALVDEVLIMPAMHLLCGNRYETRPAANDPTRCLTDGMMGGADKAVWDGGRAELHFSLPESWHAESLLVHFRRLEGRPFAPTVTLDGVPGAIGTDSHGVARIPLNRVMERLDLAAEDATAGIIAMDEVALLPSKNLAADCSYEYEPPFSASYPDSGQHELTDGQLSGGFGDGKTVGWAKWSFAGDVSVTLDLGSPLAIDAVEAHVEGGGSAAVEFPERMAVSVSLDGSTWQPAAVYKGAKSGAPGDARGEARSALEWLRATTPVARGRFVRLVFVPRGWLMLSEVRVLSGGANVALGKSYALKPRPTGRETYADNTNLLTDGFYSKPTGGWKTCAGFNRTDPTIVLDLGAPRRMGTARIHVQGGGPGGVYFPKKVSVATSSDAKTWHPAGETSEHPPEDGKQPLAAFMGVTFDARDARFVRFHVVRHGWAMVDEIEIFPAK